MNTFLPTLYKRSTTGKINEWTIDVEANRYRTCSGYTDGVKTVSEWTVCTGKNIGKKNETTPELQTLAEATALWTKKRDLGSFPNIDDIDTPVFFKPMLAHSYDDFKGKLTFPVHSQPKLDGIRCIVNSNGMWTRNGKRLISAPHIFAEMEHLFEKDPDLVFDGELYADKFANDFNAICSLVKKTKPTWDDLFKSSESIQYHIYDFPSHPGTFIERYNALTNLRYKELDLYSQIVVVETHTANNEAELMALYEEYVTDGYEGQMIRLDAKYENKRSKSLLKHKSFIDTEYTILGVEEGTGNKAGMVGSFLYQTPEGKQFNAAPKFSWDECIAMWEHKDELIGKSATVKYFNLTPDGIPRFPYTIKIDRESYE